MRVPDQVRKCIIYVCFESKQGTKYAGTAFLVGIDIGETGKAVGYVVTAKHVIDQISSKSIDQKIILRINKNDEGIEFIESDITDWRFHPSDPAIDVAVLSYTPDRDLYEYLTIPLAMLLTDEIESAEGIDIGDEVFITGLYSHHYGKDRNLPIVRIGNIARMVEEPVSTSDFGFIDAYLIEARSIGGLSGSPVFVHLPGIKIAYGNEPVYDSGPFYLLGLIHGHWNIGKADLDWIDDEGEKINTGIAIVVPAIKILETINQPEFITVRKEIEQTILNQKGQHQQ